MKRLWCCVAVAALLGGAAASPARAGDEEKRPAASVDDLIRDLASDDFKTREAATEALGDRGEEALPALEKAAQDKDPEVRWRAEKALKAAHARAAAGPRRVPETPPAGRGARAPERRTPEPRDPATVPQDRAEERLRELEESMRRLHPEIGDMLKGMKLQKVLPREFGQIFDEMEQRLKDLDRAQDRMSTRDFWTFRYKDGKWQIERSDDPIAEKIGVRTQPVPPVARAQLMLMDTPALALEEIKPDSIALRAGLLRYDLILTVDGKPCETDKDLEILARAGDHKIGILRGGKRETVAVTVEAPPEAPPPIEPAAPPGPGPDGKLRKY